MDTRHLYSADGQWIAFLVGDDLFWRDGERLGWFQPFSQAAGWSGGMATSSNGEPIGLILENGIIEFSAALSAGAGL
jgi:hypothetical protein